MTLGGILLTAAATPSPIPSDKVPDASKVSPGLPGFIMIFLLAVAVIILVTSMNKRIRRVKLRGEEMAAREERERQEREEHGDDGPGERRPGDGPGERRPGDGDDPTR